MRTRAHPSLSMSFVCTNQSIKHTKDASLECHWYEAAVADGRYDGGAEEDGLDNGPLLGGRWEFQLGVQKETTLSCSLHCLFVFGQSLGQDFVQVGLFGVICNGVQEELALALDGYAGVGQSVDLGGEF